MSQPMTILDIIKSTFVGRKVRFYNIRNSDQYWIHEHDLIINDLDIEVTNLGGGYDEILRATVDFYCRRLSDNETVNVYNIVLEPLRESEATSVEFLED